jgi:hypothetical protein
MSTKTHEHQETGLCMGCLAETSMVTEHIRPDPKPTNGRKPQTSVDGHDPHAFELECWFDSYRKPFDPNADGGGVLHLAWGAQSYAAVTRLWQTSKGKVLRVLIEIEDANAPQKKRRGQLSDE